MQPLRFEQVASHLKRTLAPIYCIVGEEVAWVNETRHRILQDARVKDLERQVAVSPSDNLIETVEAACIPDLFSTHKIMDLFCSKQNELDSILPKIFNCPIPHLWLLTIDQVSPAFLNGKLTKQLEDKGGILIRLFAPSSSQWRTWALDKIQESQLHFSKETVQKLLTHFEGNSIGVLNFLKQAQLHTENTTVAVDALPLLAPESSTLLWEFQQSLLSSSAIRTYDLLRRLKHNGEEVLLVLWALTQTIHIVAHFQTLPAEPLPRALRLNPVLKQAYLGAARNWPQVATLGVLEQLGVVDRFIKSYATVQAWQEVERLVIALCTRVQSQHA